MGGIALQELENRLVASVDRSKLMDYTTNIARWVRLSGTPDELEAVHWVEEQLVAFGLETRILMHDAYISLPGAASLTVDGLGAIDVITHAMSAPGSGNSEIVYGPDADATGKILLIDGLATPGAVLAAQGRGARALLVINDANHHEMIVSPVWGSPTVNDLGRLPKIAAMSIRHADGQRIKERLGRGRLTATYATAVDTRWRQTPILVAELRAPGTSEYVMFSGHLDSWHLGAMDNGSANTVMLEVGRLMATVRDQLKRGLKVIFWSGHSHGRYSGSTWYCDNHWQDLYDNCVAHVNIDSAGGMNASVLTEAMVHPELAGLGAAIIGQHAGVTYEGRRVNRSSDQSFVGVGVPSLWASFSEQPAGADAIGFTKLFGGNSGGLGWWWHTVHDTVDKLDPALLARDCQCYVAALSRLLLSERLPLDPEAAAADFLRELQRYAALAGERCDLSPALDRAERLVAAAAALKSAPIVAAQFNTAARLISRHLIPVAYTEAGPFGHDPALAVAPLPALRAVADLVATEPGSDAARFVQPLVTRGLNQVVFALEGALRAVFAWQ